MGVRNALDAATATAIRNGSGETSRLAAIWMPTGAATMVVAVLFSTSDRVIVTSISTVSTTHAGSPWANPTSAPAISSVPPELSSAAPNGIIDPSKTTTGHSIWV